MARAKVCPYNGQCVIPLRQKESSRCALRLELNLPPYLPDFNPIEFFAELKASIKRNWSGYAENPEQEFDRFLEWCVNVGTKEQSAKGHFRVCRGN